MDTEPPSWLLSQLFSNFLPFWGLTALLAAIFLSAVMSGYETLLSYFKTDGNSHNENIKPYHTLQTLSKNPGKLQLTIVFVKLIGYILTIILSNAVMAYFGVHSETVFFKILKVVIPVLIILIFGEILPKIYASQRAQSHLITYRHFLIACYFLFWPFTYPLQKLSQWMQEKLGKPPAQLDVTQLSQVLDLNNTDVSKEEEKILKGIVSFGNTEVRRIMKPRVEIFSLEKNENYSEILPKIVEQGYSRIPVYEENLDNVVGVLYVKDLVPYINHPNFDWSTLLRTPYFIAETKKLSDLLNDFKEKQVHLAIVTDEYGSTEGIVSLEDVIEEIVGEISDEYDQEDVSFSKISENTYIFEGKTNLKDFYRGLQLENFEDFEEAREEAETLAGFVLEISPEFPKMGDVINFKNYSFTVEAFENKRISRIRVTIS